MINKFENIINSYKQGASEDNIGLWNIINSIEKTFKPSDANELMELTLDIIQDMLADGFQAGDSEYSETGYIPWKIQNTDYVINRIRTEWLALGREPNIGDIVYFGFKE